jgi:prevent-host-death family protein
MRISTTTDARANFQDIINKVHYTKVPTIITKRGRPWVIIQSLPEEDSELEAMLQSNETGKK